MSINNINIILYDKKIFWKNFLLPPFQFKISKKYKNIMPGVAWNKIKKFFRGQILKFSIILYIFKWIKV